MDTGKNSIVNLWAAAVAISVVIAVSIGFIGYKLADAGVDFKVASKPTNSRSIPKDNSRLFAEKANSNRIGKYCGGELSRHLCNEVFKIRRDGLPNYEPSSLDTDYNAFRP